MLGTPPTPSHLPFNSSRTFKKFENLVCIFHGISDGLQLFSKTVSFFDGSINQSIYFQICTVKYSRHDKICQSRGPIREYPRDYPKFSVNHFLQFFKFFLKSLSYFNFFYHCTIKDLLIFKYLFLFVQNFTMIYNMFLAFFK